MSRNKFILLVMLIVALYFITPDAGIYGTIKANFLLLLPFIMLGIIIYLIITISMLKKSWRKLDGFICDENVISFAKILNISFDVKRMLGANNMIDLYSKVNFSKHASMHAKELLYEALRRKRLDVPPPGKVTNIDNVLSRSNRTDAEIKAARIEAAAKAKRKKNKK